jgi:hypothetical protein
MPNKKISQLTEVITPLDSDVLPIVTDNETKKVQVVNLPISKTQVGLENVQNVDTTNADNITSGELDDARLSANITKQGNTFNGASELVQLDADSKLPAVDGSNLTNLEIPPSTGGDLYLFYNY